jgi:hypothetical protein
VIRRWAARFCLFAMAASFLGAAVLTLRYQREDRRSVEEAKAESRLHAARAARQIDLELREIMAAADDLAAGLERGRFPRERLLDRLRQAVVLDPEVVEAGVAYAPFAFDPGLRLHARAYALARTRPELVEIDAGYDYTEPGHEWYHRPLREGPVWLKPAYDKNIGQRVAVYAVPFRSPASPAPQGVLFFALPVRYLQKLMDRLDLGEAGYGAVAAADGDPIFHPGNVVGSAAAKTADYWTFEEPIPAAGWRLRLVRFEEDVTTAASARRASLIGILVLAIAGALFLALSLFLGKPPTEARLWSLAAVTAGLLFCGVWGIWFLHIRNPEPQSSERLRMTNPARLDQFRRDRLRAALASHEDLPLFIPTGIFVESVTFDSSSTVSVTGYIWQKLTLGRHDGLARGVVLPQSLSVDMKEAYRRTKDGVELVGWYFKTTLRQGFDFSRYPFGRENIGIQLWPQDFHRNVILVPDLEAYKFINPSAQPGLRNDLELPGWFLERSFFSYRSHDYSANFGYDEYIGQEDFPELYFNIVADKELIGPFVSYILPVNVILVMLFILLMIASRAEDRRSFLGFTALDVSASCAAFFLVSIFSHIDLRKELQAKEIVYLEYFYFVTYALILSVSVNSLLLIRSNNRLIQYRDNLIPKLLFWPASQLAMFLVTLYHFL